MELIQIDRHSPRDFDVVIDVKVLLYVCDREWREGNVQQEQDIGTCHVVRPIL